MFARTMGLCGFKRGMLAAATAFAILTPILPASAADFVMKFGTATMNETQHQFIKFYKEEVEKASGGRIEVQIYPASQLGPIPREIEGVQLGTIQGYIGPVDFFVGVDPRFGVFSAPLPVQEQCERHRDGAGSGDAKDDVRHGWHRSAWSASPP